MRVSVGVVEEEEEGGEGEGLGEGGVVDVDVEEAGGVTTTGPFWQDSHCGPLFGPQRPSEPGMACTPRRLPQ